jgi:hypothetical protein
VSAALAHDFDGSEGFVNSVLFKPVGPVASGFVNDRMFISSIMGPYGSAKTTSCFQKILNAAAWQNPARATGCGGSACACIRDTYGQLETNVMKDWFSWFPKDEGQLERRAQHAHAAIHWLGLGIIEIEMIFIGLGELKAEGSVQGHAADAAVAERSRHAVARSAQLRAAARRPLSGGRRTAAAPGRA